MASNPIRAEPSPGALEELEGLEELGDEAIIAQQNEAHAPSKRAQVNDELRSVVISDSPPQSSQRVPVARSERGEATIVLQNRAELDDIRRRIRVRQRKLRAKPWLLLLWLAVALSAITVGGVAVFLLARAPDGEAEDAANASADRATTARNAARLSPAQISSATEVVPPQVRVEELPIEKPAPP